ncbi:conserved Plasmodium protein, unknown function [Plasmodium chabaudi adami]|uniref:Saccharopine dehydrogenase NADP binding domain-containing protein n=1 Tax=Plasmodium chabaudi adami TaxID=5826 RepID=A0A1D3LFS9_PLACE|nr:conserved Plasmodium protein, unknown function [Plasmodium chabaudi adami]
MSLKQYDILLLGSTGYTGEMVLEYLLENYEIKIKTDKLKILCGVRNVNKLNNILLKIKERINVECIDKINTKECDVENYESVLNCAMLCKVVISTVGPYGKYGYTIVKACIDGSCDYLDACGEHDFILNVYKEYNKIAKEKELKIIHSASFISAISDLGNLIIQEEFEKKYKSACSYVRIRLSSEGSNYRTVGKATLKSYLLFKKTVGNKYNKYYLCQGGDSNSDCVKWEDKHKTQNFCYEKEFGYCFDTTYSVVEETYVLWSNYLLNYKYGKNLVIDYKQYDSDLSYFKYMIKVGLFYINSFFSNFTFIDYLLDKYVDNFHKVKTSSELKKCNWKCTIVGESENDNISNTDILKKDEQNKQVVLNLQGKNEDPGYLLTAKIISEAAISLVENKTDLNTNFGVMSVSVGLGWTLIDRLKQAAISITIDK